MLNRAPRSQAMDVADAFTEVADHYDALVRLNPGYHEHLRASARVLLEQVSQGDDPVRLLDLGCGSGASTEALVAAVHEHGRIDSADVQGVDASAGMLAAASSKGWPDWVRFRVGRAQDLGQDGGLSERYFDGILAAYLVRNVPERDQLMADLYRCLRPGGTLVLHEYVVRDSRWATLVWSLVCWSIVIPLAGLVTGENRLHRYLWRSVLDFDSMATLQERLHRAGFSAIRRRTFNNWQRGILHTVLATRPEQ